MCDTCRAFVADAFWSGHFLPSLMRGRPLLKPYHFPITIEPDNFEDGREAWHAFCPGLKGCHTWGHTPRRNSIERPGCHPSLRPGFARCRPDESAQLTHA